MNKNEWYKTGIRILMLIHRRKDGGHKRKDRKSRRLISTCPQEFDQHLEFLQEQKDESNALLRIYSSANERDIVKAIRLYKMQQVEIEFQDTQRQLDFYTQTENQFISCLAKSLCAKQKNFLIDIDQGDDKQEAIKQLEAVTTIIDIRDTPNGCHIITKPYNSALTPELEIKKDAMLLLEW